MENSVFLLRSKIKAECFTDAAAAAILGVESQPNVVLSRLVGKKLLVRLRRGLYLFGPELRQGEVNLFSVSNILYGPSYVSCESALSYYGLIPEAVHVTTAVNSKRSMKFATPIGHFLYRKIPVSAFPFGIKRVAGDVKLERGATLIASREKALIDLIYLTRPRGDLLRFVTDSLRVEWEQLLRFQTRTMQQLGATYGNSNFTDLVKALARTIAKGRLSHGG